MIAIGLDLSTSTGISVFSEGALTDYVNVVRKVKGSPKTSAYPMNYIEMAEELAFKIVECVIAYSPDYIVIEETNKGKERYRQKQLEFIHSAVIRHLHLKELSDKIRYIDSSAWRSILGLSLDSDQRSSNKARKKERDEKRDGIREGIKAGFQSQIDTEIQGLKKRATNKILKQWDKKIEELVGKEMRKFRSSIKVVDQKTLSVDYVNEVFKLGFKRSQNDIADSICVVYSFIKNNYSSTVVR